AQGALLLDKHGRRGSALPLHCVGVVALPSEFRTSDVESGAAHLNERRAAPATSLRDSGRARNW
ncbi:unnamed protein product, partial [Amoebophrya sp. A120]